MLRADARPDIRHRDRDTVASACRRRDAEYSWLLLGRHRVDGVGDQVDQHLLKLHSIASHLRQLPGRLRLDSYSVLLQIAALEGQRFLNELVDIERRSGPVIVPEVRANAFDHPPGTMAIRNNPFQRLPGLVEIGRRTIEKAKARIG